MPKLIFFIVVLLICGQDAFPDTLLKFRDGSANVWDNIYERGRSYCTKKGTGVELCVDKAEVAQKKTVEPGANGLEYGTGVAGLPPVSDNVRGAEYQKTTNTGRTRNAADDRQQALERQKSGSQGSYGNTVGNQTSYGNSVTTPAGQSSSTSAGYGNSSGSSASGGGSSGTRSGVVKQYTIPK